MSSTHSTNKGKDWLKETSVMKRHDIELLALVQERYPGWEDVTEPAFAEDELQYKYAAAAQASTLLQQTEYQALLNSQQYDELINRLETVSKATNLLWRRMPRRGDTAILYTNGLNKAEFTLAVRDLLFGSGPTPTRLEQYARYAAANRLPLSWPFPTYLLFLLHPQNELFVKPEPIQWWLKFLGVGEVWTKTPGAAAYTAIRYHAHQLKQALNLPDMIAVQSLIWVASQQAKQRTGRLSSRGQIELEIPDDEIDEPEYLVAPSYSILKEPLFVTEQESELPMHEKSELPSYADFVNPTLMALKLLGGTGTVKEIEDKVCEILGLTLRQRQILHSPPQNYPSEIGYRIAWNRTWLKLYGAIKSPSRGVWQLTTLGQSIDQLDLAEVKKVVSKKSNRTGEGNDVTPENFDDTVQSDLNDIEITPDISLPIINRTPSMVGVEPIRRRKMELSEVAAATGFDIPILQRWLKAIERKGQAVVYGPPGTGKTFVARHLADYLAQDRGFVTILQFHPAYTYEDFIEGIRPQETQDGRLELKMVPGRFYSFCELARRSPEAICVLILDEINRANLSRVFGELMYLLEYRNERIFLAGHGMFGIPANVRIIGTMNTADRSIALVDHALRRRFAFLELAPNYDLLRYYHQQENQGWNPDGLIHVLERLNSQIDKHYQVGVTFFMRPQLATELRDIWEMEILPYLEEYFFDQLERIEPFRWERIAKEVSSF